jgi:transposase
MSDMDTSGAKRRYKRWPEALKREIVAATLVPGASVSVVARQYDVNANQVFGWRRRYRDEPATPSSLPSTPGLVAVTITREPEDEEPPCRRRLLRRRSRSTLRATTGFGSVRASILVRSGAFSTF